MTSSQREHAPATVPRHARLPAPGRVTGAAVPGRVARLTGQVQALSAEIGKFVVVGGFCFVLDIAVANALHVGLGAGPTISKAASTALATFVSYLGNRAWAFAHRVDEQAGHGRDLGMFMVINLVGLLITLIPVDVGHYLLSMTSTLAFNVTSLLGTAVATAFRFWAYRRFVFTAGSAAHRPACRADRQAHRR